MVRIALIVDTETEGLDVSRDRLRIKKSEAK